VICKRANYKRRNYSITQTYRKAGLEHNIQQAELQKVIVQRKAELQKANFDRNIQQTELKRVHTQRNFTFGGIAAL
jgi:hypothetical protein